MAVSAPAVLGTSSAEATVAAAPPPLPFDMAAELAALKEGKPNQNRGLHRLPPNHTVQRRPLDHAPVANMHAGKKIPKVVYVSQRTPLMAAVKRVKKMLLALENQAAKEGGLKRRNLPKHVHDKHVRERSEEEKKIVVKASGRAMEKALKVGEWFRNKEKEFLCRVEVAPGSVSVVDDIVPDKSSDEDEEGGVDVVDQQAQNGETSVFVDHYGDTTLELGLGYGPQGDVTASTLEPAQSLHLATGDTNTTNESSGSLSAIEDKRRPRRHKKKRKRPAYEVDDVPEARIRWIKTVEVAISLDG